jgi:hypothetical protein
MRVPLRPPDEVRPPDETRPPDEARPPNEARRAELTSPFNRIAKSELGISGVKATCCKSSASASSSCGVGLLPGRVLGVDGEGWGGALYAGD